MTPYPSGGSLATQTPTLIILNAADPDGDRLTYDFEVFDDTGPVWSAYKVAEGANGSTSIVITSLLADNARYQWRARAFDGDRYGPWTATASFTVHLPATEIYATINFDPDTLNQKSNGVWASVFIELPVGYDVRKIDRASLRLEGTIPAERRPSAVGDHDNDGIPDLMVKFKRSEVIAVLSAGRKVPVQVTGKIGARTFEGVDIIRVIK